MFPPPEDLVDHSLIEIAAKAEAAARARLADTTADLDAIRKRHSAARHASERALTGAGPLTPMAAEDDLDAAARMLRVAEKVRAAAEAGVVQAVADAETAEARAWAPVRTVGVQGRLAAVAKGERAMKLLGEAEAELKDATRMIALAAQHRCPARRQNLHNGLRVDLHRDRPIEVLTEERERAAWIGEHLDPDTGMCPWLQQFETKGA